MGLGGITISNLVRHLSVMLKGLEMIGCFLDNSL